MDAVMIIMKNKFPNDTTPLFLGTRSTGREIGKEIFDNLSNGKNLLVDFEDVDSVTQSFIDEILGVSFRFFGPSIIKKMKFRSCNDEIKKTIKFVHAYSKEMSSEQMEAKNFTD